MHCGEHGHLRSVDRFAHRDDQRSPRRDRRECERDRPGRILPALDRKPDPEWPDPRLIRHRGECGRDRWNDLQSRAAQSVYLTQATQRYDGTVPLVAGRNAYLRVFALANEANSAQPPVRVRLYSGLTLVQTYTTTAPVVGVPMAVNEGTITGFWNVLVPGALVQPNLRVLPTSIRPWLRPRAMNPTINSRCPACPPRWMSEPCRPSISASFPCSSR